jgi:hypothetical protein
LQDNNKTNYNLVCETLKFLDAICGSQTGLLGLLGNYINEDNVELINQALNTLTEYCQGPCRDNQDAIVNHESNGIDIIIAIVLNDITPLNQKNYDLVLELKVRDCAPRPARQSLRLSGQRLEITSRRDGKSR